MPSSDPLSLTLPVSNTEFHPVYIAGYEAVVQLGDGTRCYLAGPPAPYGTLGELVPVITVSARHGGPVLRAPA